MKRIRQALIVFAALGLYAPLAHANSSFELELGEGRYHVTADRTLYHTKEKVYEAFGHVVISGKSQRLSADYAWLDTISQELRAKGNVIYVTPESLVQAAEIHFNMQTQLGSIFYGRVMNDAYTLRGQLIRKVAEDRFLTTDGEYSTCKDCPESWKFTAKDLDVTFDGYAYMDSVFINVKDTPAVYLPYLIVPVKTRRQTGFLFPKLSTSAAHGFAWVEPFFLAINKHQDATIGFGRYALRGQRLELEYRYKNYDGMEGILNAYHTKDHSAATPLPERWAVKTDNDWPVMKHADVRWRVYEVSDQDYPHTFAEDIIGDYLPALESNAVVYSPFQDFFAAAEVRRYRNLLYDKDVGFDGGTVQAAPTVHFGLRERKAGPLLFNFYGRYDNFTRHNGPIYDANNDNLYDPSKDQLREARRFMLLPEIASPFRVGDVVAVSPSVQYQELQYFFDLPTQSQEFSHTSQRYLLTRLDTNVVFERVFDYNGERVIRLKSQISPFVNYSYIPWRDEDSKHPFQTQLRQEGGIFDQFDVIPLSNSTNFLRHPLGNSILYGFNSRLVRKFRSPDEMPKVYPYDRIKKKPREYPKPQNRKEELSIEDLKIWEAYHPRYEDYQEIWTLFVSQAYDFIDARKQEDKTRAFSFLQAKSSLNVDDFSNTIDYRYYPRLVVPATLTNPTEQVFSNKHSISTSTTWYWKKLANARNTLIFQRGFTLGFTNLTQPSPSRNISLSVDWSFNDFFRVQGLRNYDLMAKQLLEQTFRTIYSSPSECWQLGLRYTQTHNTGTAWGLDLGINLMGQGYVGLSQLGDSKKGSGT